MYVLCHALNFCMVSCLEKIANILYEFHVK